MSGSIIVDVAIGVVLMYLIVSLFCTILVEWIAQIFQSRASHLRRAVRKLLGSGGSVTGDTILKHPLVALLGPDRWLGARWPAYIPAHNFALALLHELAKSDDAPAARPDADAPVVPTGPVTESADAQFMASLQTNLKKLPAGAQDSLSAVIATAGGKREEIIKGIEAWYDAAMDHASGWYKRNTQWWLLIIGGLLAAAANADTLQVAARLAADADLRGRVTAMAELVEAQVMTQRTATPSVAEGPEEGGGERASERPPVSEPTAETAAPTEQASAGPTTGTDSVLNNEVADGLKRLQAELAKQLEGGDLQTGFGSLPVGWDECYLGEKFDVRACYLTATQRERLAGGAAGSLWFVSGVAYAAKGLGLLLTALAASLGAPFWFGLLQQLNAIRRTGPRPVSSTSG